MRLTEGLLAHLPISHRYPAHRPLKATPATTIRTSAPARHEIAASLRRKPSGKPSLLSFEWWTTLAITTCESDTPPTRMHVLRRGWNRQSSTGETLRWAA